MKLPTQEQIEVIIEKKLEKHDNSLLKFQRKSLAAQMSGYSPFDIDKLIDFVMDEKYELMTKSTFFTKDKKGCYNLCKPTDRQAINIPFERVRELEYNFPMICYKDLLLALNKVKPSNNLEDEEEFEKFVENNKK